MIKAAVAKYGFPSVYEATGLVSRAKYPDTYSMELHYMAIDGVSFIFAPFEMFGVTGREIKDNSPYEMTFVMGYSNGSNGYLPTRRAFEYRCYEANTTKFAPGIGEGLSSTFVKLLQDLKEK